MKIRDEIGLRALIAAVFLLLVMLPVLFIGAGLRQIDDEARKNRLQLAEQELKNEAREFQADLNARQHIEKIIKKAERRAGLSSPSLERPKFPPGVDPQIFQAGTIDELRALYRDMSGVEPLMMVAFSADVYNIWKWFSPALDDIAPQDRERVGQILSMTLAEQAGDFVRVDDSRPDAEQRYCETLRLASDPDEGLTPSYFNVMGRLFSDMIYPLPFQGGCYETATRKLGECRLFAYYRRVKDGPKIMGGYFVMFAGSAFPPKKLLKDALKYNAGGFIRTYLNRPPIDAGKAILCGNRLTVESAVPIELIGYNSLFSRQIKLPAGLQTTYDISAIMAESAAFNRSLQFTQQLLFLFCLFVSAYFVLFGFPAVVRLRLRMLLSISLAVLMPYTILGHVSLRLLDRSESLGSFELRADAEGQMQKLHSYYNDQRQQHLLQMLKIKNRLINVAALSGSEIISLHAHNVVVPGTFVDFYFFRNDGIGRSFKARNITDLEMSKLEQLLSVKFLENLGCLDTQAPPIKKLQQMTSVADGMMDTLRRDYFDYRILKYEANETMDMNRFDDFSRAIWFLIPEPGSNPVKIRAMASTNVSNLNFIIYSPYEFDPGIFFGTSGRNQHHFLMGHRRHDDMVLRWWPDHVSPDHNLKVLLDKAAAGRVSTGELTGSAGYYRYEKQRFSESDLMVYAGISTSSPDLMVALVARAFPFLLLAFALTSLLLFADALEALFINPVKGIGQAAAAVAAGDYQNRLVLEKTDEFSVLADAFNDMTNGLAQREKMRRFVSENLYDRLGAATGLKEMASVQSSRVTMLASDIRGFTTLSEQHDPQQIVSLLNDYFTCMETAIKSHGGVIERFVGDAVMAVFYSGGEKPAEVCAAEAALAMRQQLAALNQKRLALGLFTVENGIGIATGEAVSGIAGREGGRMVFAVLGEVTQRAETLEGLTKSTSSKILVCDETGNRLTALFDFGISLDTPGGPAFELCARRGSGGSNG
ncbi:hypothetical protein MASR1M12_05690 [Erysipelotrichia bacterium]